MSIKHCCNSTTKQVKRHVVTQLTEVSETDGSTFTGENHAGLVAYAPAAGNEVFYPGHEHWPCGVLQYNPNPV